MAAFKEFPHLEFASIDDPTHFRAYSMPVNFFWESARVTLLQMFPMYGISILNFDHSHSFMDISYVFSGSGSIKVGEELVPIRRGSLSFINSKVTHRIISDAEAPLTVANVSFEISPIRTSDKITGNIISAEERLLQTLTRADFLSADDCFDCENFLYNALAFKESSVPGDFVHFKNCMSNYLVSAFQLLTGLDKDKPDNGCPEDEMIYSAMKMVYYMRDHFTEGITLNDVAAALNYSPRQCQRLIQDFLGVGFSEFILAHQIRLAKRLLAKTEITLEEIAEQCGFKSSTALNQQFKAVVGVTPFAFRKAWKQNGENEKFDDFS